jgi:uncharacterized protein YqhQ
MGYAHSPKTTCLFTQRVPELLLYLEGGLFIMGVGGSATNNGVMFVSDRHSAQFIMQKDGSYEINTAKRIVKGGVRRVVEKIPLVKGIFSLFDSSYLISIIVGSMLCLDLFQISNRSIPHPVTISLFIVMIFCMAYVVKKMLYKIKNLWSFHGAEHKTILAYEDNAELSLENVRKYPRIAKRCGTNLVVFAIPLFLMLYHFIGYSSIGFVLSYAIAYELFDLENGDKLPVLRIVFKLGYWFQHNLFTIEPTNAQLSASIETINRLIELDANDFCPPTNPLH